MKYTKISLSVDDQIDTLAKRGLGFKNIASAKMKLESVSYYRLRAYTYPFQDNDNPAHPFVVDIGFDDIFDLYSFDHLIRSEVFNMLGIIGNKHLREIVYYVREILPIFGAVFEYVACRNCDKKTPKPNKKSCFRVNCGNNL